MPTAISATDSVATSSSTRPDANATRNVRSVAARCASETPRTTVTCASARRNAVSTGSALTSSSSRADRRSVDSAAAPTRSAV